MNEPLGVSIIVVNYNNERFLAAAIDSALSQEHPLCEIIVVDDCSTDNSREVIEQYGDRVRCVLHDTNVGQIAATNSAWPLARHPLLMFVDSDDLLLPYAAAAVAECWTAATVKIQFPLLTIDKQGRQIGALSPKYPPNLDTVTIRGELLRTGGSPNSAGTGNAYSRSLLDRITADGGFEIENPRDISMDTILECNSPFYGEVITLYQPFACYRIHDANDNLYHTVDSGRFDKMRRYIACKVHYLGQRCRAWGIPFNPTAVRNNSAWALECELVTAKLGSTEPRALEPISNIVYHAMKAYMNAPMTISQRIFRALWFISVAAAPRSVARRLIALRFVITERPAWLELMLGVAYRTGALGGRATRATDLFTV